MPGKVTTRISVMMRIGMDWRVKRANDDGGC
jgi:hypothetical protein